MIYFTSDWHLHHANIIRFCNRPFTNIDQMGDTIINNANKVAGPDDLIINFGDIAFGPRDNDAYVELVKSYLDRLKCRNIILIPGNHDRPFARNKRGEFIWDSWGYAWNKPFCDLFTGVHPGGIELKITRHMIDRYKLPRDLYKMMFTCSHYAHRVWNKSHRNYDSLTSIMLYGHSHSTLPPIRNSFDVGVDCWDFELLSLPRVIEEVHKVNAKLPDNDNELVNKVYNEHHEQ